MLERLEMRDTGPAASMRFDLAPRLNVFAGDNGLGKTFVLDVAWWALTGTWAGYEAAPHRDEGAHPTIGVAVRTAEGVSDVRATYDVASQEWNRLAPGDWGQRLVFYARVDGGCSVADGLRWTSAFHRQPSQRRPAYAFDFEAEEIWDGAVADDGTTVCNGLIRDWTTWQLQRGPTFDLLTRVLEGLSPHPGETIRPGASTTRVSIHDVRDIPTIDLPYGTIPVVHASAGMRRILGFAYMLVWMWREHVEAAKLKNVTPSKSLVVLFDEVESHLHPQWQRVILPALLRVVRELSPEIDVQILATTHAPLVLASLEPHFDDAKDALFHFDVHGKDVTVEKLPWRMRGDASAWLTSEVFELVDRRAARA